MSRIAISLLLGSSLRAPLGLCCGAAALQRCKGSGNHKTSPGCSTVFTATSGTRGLNWKQGGIRQMLQSWQHSGTLKVGALSRRNQYLVLWPWVGVSTLLHHHFSAAERGSTASFLFLLSLTNSKALGLSPCNISPQAQGRIRKASSWQRLTQVPQSH